MSNEPVAAREHVPAGSFVVSGSMPRILEADLGTCVGLALWDPDAQVGGIIHLLLPRHTGAESWEPAYYASTGVPLLLRAVLEAGASKDRLQACLAGGALVGTISRLDLSLDIGGHTAEEAESLLRSEGIPLRQRETGGYVLRRLSLDRQRWESRIGPCSDAPELVELPARTLDASQVDSAIESVRPIPQVVLKLMRTMTDPNHTSLVLAANIKSDQIISAKLLQLCNSASVGVASEVDSVEQAVQILGEKAILRLALTLGTEIFFNQSKGAYSLCKGGLYYHSLAAAGLAEELAKQTKLATPDSAYLAGLLHDIGKVALDQFVAPLAPFFYRRTQVEGVEICRLETEQFGVSHPEMGGRLAKKWSLPASLTDAIRYHHKPEQATVASDLTHLVYLAELLSSRFLAGREMESFDIETLDARLAKVGFRQSQLPSLISLIPRKMQELERFING
jgi:putative nucleotidyltransferase with HDIG domain